MSTPTQQPEALQVLCIVRQSNLFDALSQTISNYSLPVHCLGVSTQRDFSTAMESPPDLILADPYAFKQSNAIAYYKALHFRTGNIPLIALLPNGSPEYRDAAIQMGANHTLAWDKISSDLLPVMKRLLGRTRLIKGISKHIENSAEFSAPLGEPALKQDMSNLGSSRESLEQLKVRKTNLDEMLTQDLSPTQGTIPIQSVYLRGLGTSAVSKISSDDKRVFRTVCAHNCGPHFCGLNVTVRGQEITKIKPANFPDEHYRRLCMKGISYVQTRVSQQRLLRPLKRVGKRGEGKWEAVSWGQALDEIAEKMRNFSQIYGSESNMFLTYSGQLSVLNGMNGVYLRLAAALGASGTGLREFGVDSAIPSGIEDSFGVGSGHIANHFSDLPNSKLILIWGGNPAQSNMLWWSYFLEAKKSGNRIVTIDPRFSLTASKSDLWLPIRIGSDLYLALAILRLIIENDWMEKDFILRHTVAPLLVREDNGNFLKTKDIHYIIGGSKNLVWDEQRDRVIPVDEAGSPALSIKRLVAGITCTTAFDKLREMLQPYTPEFTSTKTGLDAQQIIELSREIAETKPTRIFTLYGIDRWYHGATFGRLIATIAAFTGNLGIPGGGAGVSGSPESVLPISQFYTPNGREYNPINPLMLPDQIISAQPHPVKSVFVAFGNWINQFPDQNRMKHEILPKLDLLVVADHFMTETARWADYILPAAFFFEREDMVIGPGPYVQYQPAIVPPVGESRSDFDIAASLAERLGCENVFSKTPGEYLAEILAQNESTRHISLDELREKGVMERKMPPDWEIVHRDRNFKTPSGRVEFYVERLLPLGRALPQYENPIEAFPENDLTAKYPLVCLTEHSRYRVHSTFSNAPWLREIENVPYASMNPDDAQQRGISENNYVKIFNARGWVVLRAHLTQAVPTGVVYLGQGWQSDDFRSGHAQSLTHSAWNPANAFGANSSFSDVLVDIMKEETIG